MRRDNAQAGFTLTEVLVVLVIVGLLVGLVGPRVMGYLTSSRADTARIQIEQLATALELYTLDMGQLPTTEEGLVALVTAPASATGWNGPYLRKADVPLDPWGTPFVYRLGDTATGFVLQSLGADRREGGDGNDADIP